MRLTTTKHRCAVVVSGKRGPQVIPRGVAAKITRALLKGASRVNTNPMAAAKFSFYDKYIAASLKFNSQAISKLKFMPGVSAMPQERLHGNCR